MILILITGHYDALKYFTQCSTSRNLSCEIRIYYDVQIDNIFDRAKCHFTHYSEKTFIKIWYLSAIEIFDTQVARRGRQYHRNPPPYKNRPTKRTVSTK